MKNIEEAIQLNSIDEIEEEIRQRKELRATMVGQLYPRILTDEIYKLNEKLWNIRHSKVLKT
jgi:hypothetical protein